MIDIKKLRENFSNVQVSLKKRGYDLNEQSFKSTDEKRKTLQVEVEALQADRKKLSSEFGKLKAADKDTSKSSILGGVTCHLKGVLDTSPSK